MKEGFHYPSVAQRLFWIYLPIVGDCTNSERSIVVSQMQNCFKRRADGCHHGINPSHHLVA